MAAPGCTPAAEALLRNLLLLALLLLPAGPLEAQEGAQAPRSPVWFSFGGGGALLDMDCGQCESLADSIPYSRGGGAHLRVGVGTHHSPRLRLGLGVAAAFRREGNRDATLLNLATLVQLYPAARVPLFLRGGIGLANSTLAGGGTLVERSGVGAHLELGADIARLGRWELSPHAGVMLARHPRRTPSQSERGGLALDAPGTPTALYLGASATRR